MMMEKKDSASKSRTSRQNTSNSYWTAFRQQMATRQQLNTSADLAGCFMSAARPCDSATLAAVSMVAQSADNFTPV